MTTTNVFPRAAMVKRVKMKLTRTVVVEHVQNVRMEKLAKSHQTVSVKFARLKSAKFQLAPIVSRTKMKLIRTAEVTHAQNVSMEKLAMLPRIALVVSARLTFVEHLLVAIV
jgi:hypothetical protein